MELEVQILKTFPSLKNNILQAAITHDGRIIHSPAVNANEGVTLGQLDNAITNIPTPTLQSVTEADNTLQDIGIIINSGNSNVALNATGALGVQANGTNTGIYANSGNLGVDVIGGNVGINAKGGQRGIITKAYVTALEAESENGVAAVFNIEEFNSSNIAEFKKAGVLQATVTHDGRIIHSPAVNNDESITKGQLEAAISGTVNTIPKFSASNTLTDSVWKEDSGRLFNGIDDLTNGFQLTGYDASINGVNMGRGKNTTTTTNTVFGRFALNSITTATSNTALGNRALYNTSTGNQNTGVGRSALDSNTTGISNTGVGANSLAFNTIGQYNVGVGSFAGYWQAEGSQNTFIGNEAGLRTSTGASNTLANNSVFIGSRSTSLGVGGNNEIVIGYNASGLGTNTTVIGGNSTVTTAIRGRGLFGTLTDNGVDAVQVNGTISAIPATTASQVIVKSQLDSAISSLSVPTLEQVTESGATAYVTTQFYVEEDNQPSIRTRNDGAGNGIENITKQGVACLNLTTSGIGSRSVSTLGIGSTHELGGATNTNNISEFKKASILQAAITHDGRIIHSPAVNSNEGVTLGQVQSLIATPAITTVLANNTGASLGALNANTTVNLNLNTNSIWTTNTTASKTGATVAEIIDPATGRIKDVSDKNLNTIRVVIEYSQSGGAGDGVLTGQLVNPSGVVIDQESEPINVNGTAETNVRGTFRFFVVKTSDNNLGYTLRLSNGAKALTAYRIVSVLRNNNP